MAKIALTLLVGGGFLMFVGNFILNVANAETPKFLEPLGGSLMIAGFLAVFACPIILIWWT